MSEYKTFKCTTPKCKAKATTMIFVNKSIGRRCVCDQHAQEQINNGATVIKQGKQLLRKECNAWGGWQGWEYEVIE